MIDTILNTIFPNYCVVCRTQVFERRHGAACPGCWQLLEPLPMPWCDRCGMPEAAIDGLCGPCRREENAFDMARSALLFNEPLRVIVHHLKYSDRVSLARPLGEILRDCLTREPFTADLAIPVPLHRVRQRQRGYNQADLLAHALGLSVETRLLRRHKATPSQTGLSRTQRRHNLAGAFEVQGDVKGGRFVIVDDVFTTGATTNEMARALKRAGAERVEVLTVGRVPLP